MSLNDIKMPAQLIAGLYPDTLVETELTAMEVRPALEHPEMEEPVMEHAVEEQTIEEQPISVQPSGPVQPVKSEQKQFDYQGNNRKQILILTSSEKAQYLPDQELKFLVSILKACALATEDVAIMNVKKQTADHTALQLFFQCRTALLFGLEPQDIDLPMNFPQFQLQNFNKCTYLHAPALEVIENDKGLKMKLWGCLKNLFSL